MILRMSLMSLTSRQSRLLRLLAVRSGHIGTFTNWPAVWAWSISVIISAPVALLTVLEVFFTPVLTIVLSFSIHVGLSTLRVNQSEIEISSTVPADPENPNKTKTIVLNHQTTTISDDSAEPDY